LEQAQLQAPRRFDPLQPLSWRCASLLLSARVLLDSSPLRALMAQRSESPVRAQSVQAP
jgi:hypothetical protein